MSDWEILGWIVLGIMAMSDSHVRALLRFDNKI